MILQLLILTVLLSACNMQVDTELFISEKLQLDLDEKFVFLTRSSNNPFRLEDKTFVKCLDRKLSAGGNFSTLDNTAFFDLLYPWFEKESVPKDIKAFEDLIKIPEVAARFNTNKIRYLIWLDGETTTTGKKGGISCTVTPGGGACFGYKTWDNHTNFIAEVWDTKRIRLSAKIGTEAEGTSHVLAIFLPLPLIARTSEAACESMAEQLLLHLKNQ